MRSAKPRWRWQTSESPPGPSPSARGGSPAAPRTVEKFRSLLPYRERIIHVRWSGEACWIPLGVLDLGLGYENATSYPAPGQVILHPGGGE